MLSTLGATVLFLVLAAHEGAVGLRMAFRTRRTFDGAGLRYSDGPGIVLQEFGVYSLAIAAAYLVAAIDPARFWPVAIAGLAVNIMAGSMHLLRSRDVYFGDAVPMLPARAERKSGLTHALAAIALCGTIHLSMGAEAIGLA